MGDILQGFLDAKTSRVGLAAGGALFIVGPVGKPALRKTAHAFDLVLPDLRLFFRDDENQGLVRGTHDRGETLVDPFVDADQIPLGDIDDIALAVDIQRPAVIAHQIGSIGDLAVGAGLKLLQEFVVDGRGIEPGRAVAVQNNIAFLKGQQFLFPFVRDPAFLGKKRTGAKLKGDRTQFLVVNPVGPVAQVPDPAGHDDRNFANAHFAHIFPEQGNPWVGILRFIRVFNVGQPVVAAGQPWILIDNRAEKIGEFPVGPLPQGLEGVR